MRKVLSWRIRSRDPAAASCPSAISNAISNNAPTLLVGAMFLVLLCWRCSGYRLLNVIILPLELSGRTNLPEIQRGAIAPQARRSSPEGPRGQKSGRMSHASLPSDVRGPSGLRQARAPSAIPSRSWPRLGKTWRSICTCPYRPVRRLGTRRRTGPPTCRPGETMPVPQYGLNRHGRRLGTFFAASMSRHPGAFVPLSRSAIRSPTVPNPDRLRGRLALGASSASCRSRPDRHHRH